MRYFAIVTISLIAWMSLCGTLHARDRALSGGRAEENSSFTNETTFIGPAPIYLETAHEYRQDTEPAYRQDTTLVYKDSVRLAIESLTRKAWRRSLILPGWGQVTNGGIWWIKVPVIYGGFVTTGLIFEFNNRYYRSILKDVQYRLANNHAVPPDSPYDYIAADSQGTAYLINAKDYYRRNRDYMVLITLAWYALNGVEAYVDSMLKNRWEIADGLTVQVNPTFTPAAAYTYTNPLAASSGPVFGFNIKINLK